MENFREAGMNDSYDETQKIEARLENCGDISIEWTPILISRNLRAWAEQPAGDVRI
ncbi:hypothetical protein PBN151_5301 [Paenibacillus sp. NAIST15-1]|nr:hypothetical protein PBN151_5301 [Paenibacillus sp. NAIST15-1]